MTTRRLSRFEILALLVPMAAVSPFAAVRAQGFGPLPYDYFAANLALTDLDSGGIELAGSMEIVDRVVVFAGYQDWELSEHFDRKTLQIGGGYRWDLRPNLDFVARAAFADNEIDPPGRAEFDDEGLVVSGEFRGWLTRSIELLGVVALDNSIGSNTETIVEFGGQYHRRGNASFGGRLRVDEDETTLFIGVRYYFGASNRGRGGP